MTSSTIKRSVTVAVLALWCAPPAVAQTPSPEVSVALLSKVILEVSRQEPGRDWRAARRGETLNSGDRVRTGVKSIAIIKFKDNSLVRVRERSQLIVLGTTARTGFSKSVNIETGVVGFNVRKQQPEEEFRFTSPTSVASIRGTSGMLAVSDTTDVLTVLDGTVDLANSVSSRSAAVAAGYTGISSSDGNLTVREATAEERQAAEDAVKTGDQQKKLEIELRDGQGKAKRLRIDYKE